MSAETTSQTVLDPSILEGVGAPTVVDGPEVPETLISITEQGYVDPNVSNIDVHLLNAKVIHALESAPNTLKFTDIPQIIEGKSIHDPIDVAESNYMNGKHYGAVKVSLESFSPIVKDFAVAVDRTVINKPYPEIEKLNFYSYIYNHKNLDNLSNIKQEDVLTAFADFSRDVKDLDLFGLYKEIQNLGGFSNVTPEKWQEISKRLGKDAKFLYLKYCKSYQESPDTFANDFGKRCLAPVFLADKRPKRSIKAKSNGKVLLNLPFSLAYHKTGPKHIQYNIYLTNLIKNQTYLDDYALLPQISSISEVIKNDKLLQDTLFSDNLTLNGLETSYWKRLQSSDPVISLSDTQISLNGHRNKLNCHSSSSEIESSLDPWNLSNAQILPNSILSCLHEGNTNSNSFFKPKLQIGGTFSTSLWKYEDHFTQKINRQLVGYKKWYIIPELEFEKVNEIIEENFDFASQVQKSKLQELRSSENFSSIIMKLFDNNYQNDVKLQSKIQYLNRLCNLQEDINAKEVFLTPEVIEKSGIKCFTAIQRPGDYIIQYPKSYCMSFSIGFSISEEINFASPLWLNYAMDGEIWLRKQRIIPLFSTFKLFTDLCQVSEPKGQNNQRIHLSADVKEIINKEYSLMVDKEVDLRNIMRNSNFQIKELTIDEKSLDSTLINDFDFSSSYPTRILLNDRESGERYSFNLTSFMEFFSSGSENAKTLLEFISKEKISVEMHSFYSDEKLKEMGKFSSLNNDDFEEWVENYEKLFEEYDSIPLKNFKSILSEGEKIYNSILPIKNYSRFKGGKDFNRLEYFKACLEHLRSYIDFANGFVEKCQSIISIKHQQRIRNENEDNTSLMDPEEILPQLVELINQISRLSFNCLEIDQVVEFMDEIENFERATRLLISKENPQLFEFEELINLGKSFGINLKSLKFLIRIRDKIKWIKIYNIILSGGDPFQDKKQMFSLSNLVEFYENGIKVLSAQDVDKLKKIENIVKNSYELISKIDTIMHPQEVDESLIKRVDKLVDEIDERYKLENEHRIFINIEKFDELLDFKTSLESLDKLYDLKTSIEVDKKKFTLEEMTALHDDLEQKGLPISERDWSIIKNPLEEAKKSMESCLEAFKDYKLITNIGYQFKNNEFKNAYSKQLLTEIKKLIGRTSIAFAFDSDNYKKCSSYQFRNSEENQDHNHIYCLCREYEYGSMVECDKCKEWYHDSCIEITRNVKKEAELELNKDPAKPKKRISKKMLKKTEEQALNDKDKMLDEESFICPVCDLITSGKNSDSFLSSQLSHLDLIKTITRLKSIPVYAPEELNGLEELNHNLIKASISLFKRVYRIKSSGEKIPERIDKLYFLLRKVYGAGIIVEDLLYEILSSIRRYEALVEFENKMKERLTILKPSVQRPSSEDTQKEAGHDSKIAHLNGNKNKIDEGNEVSQTKSEICIPPESESVSSNSSKKDLTVSLPESPKSQDLTASNEVVTVVPESSHKTVANTVDNGASGAILDVAAKAAVSEPVDELISKPESTSKTTDADIPVLETLLEPEGVPLVPEKDPDSVNPNSLSQLLKSPIEETSSAAPPAPAPQTVNSVPETVSPLPTTLQNSQAPPPPVSTATSQVLHPNSNDNKFLQALLETNIEEFKSDSKSDHPVNVKVPFNPNSEPES